MWEVEPQKSGFVFKWNALRTLFHSRLFKIFSIEFSIFLRHCTSASGHVSCVEEERKSAICLDTFACGLACGYILQINGRVICLKYTNLQDISDLKLNLYMRKEVYQISSWDEEQELI